MSRDTFVCQDLGREKGEELGVLPTSGEQREARDAAIHPTMHEWLPRQKIILPKISIVPRLRNSLSCLGRKSSITLSLKIFLWSDQK